MRVRRAADPRLEPVVGEPYVCRIGQMNASADGRIESVIEIRLEIEFSLPYRTRTLRWNSYPPAKLVAISHETVRARIEDGDPAVLKVMLAISKALAGRLASMTEKFIEIEWDCAPAQSNELREFREKLFSDWSFDRVQ